MKIVERIVCLDQLGRIGSVSKQDQLELDRSLKEHGRCLEKLRYFRLNQDGEEQLVLLDGYRRWAKCNRLKIEMEFAEEPGVRSVEEAIAWRERHRQGLVVEKPRVELLTGLEAKAVTIREANQELERHWQHWITVVGKTLREAQEILASHCAGFEKWCRAEFGWSRRYITFLMQAYDVTLGIQEVGNQLVPNSNSLCLQSTYDNQPVRKLPENERQCRELAIVPKEQLPVVWRDIVDDAEHEKKQISAEYIRKKLKKLGIEKPKPLAPKRTKEEAIQANRDRRKREKELVREIRKWPEKRFLEFVVTLAESRRVGEESGVVAILKALKTKAPKRTKSVQVELVEERPDDVPLPASIRTAEMQGCWTMWLKDLRKRGVEPTVGSVTMQLKGLAKCSESTAIRLVEHAIAHRLTTIPKAQDVPEDLSLMDEQTVLDYADRKGWPVQDAKDFYAHFAQQNWKRSNGQFLTDWRISLAQWVESNAKKREIEHKSSSDLDDIWDLTKSSL